MKNNIINKDDKSNYIKVRLAHKSSQVYEELLIPSKEFCNYKTYGSSIRLYFIPVLYKKFLPFTIASSNNKSFTKLII